jgi:hypothetical protein
MVVHVEESDLAGFAPKHEEHLEDDAKSHLDFGLCDEYRVQ